MMDLGTIGVSSCIKEKKLKAFKVYLAKCKMLCSANAGNEIENHINEFISLEELFSGCIEVSFPDLEWYWEDGEGLTTKMLIQLAKYLEDGEIWLDDQLKYNIIDGKLYNVVTKYSTGKKLRLTSAYDVRERKDKKIGIILFEGE